MITLNINVIAQSFIVTDFPGIRKQKQKKK